MSLEHISTHSILSIAGCLMTPVLSDNSEGKTQVNATNSEKIHRSLQFRTLSILDHGTPKSWDVWSFIFPLRKLWLKQLSLKVLTTKWFPVAPGILRSLFIPLFCVDWAHCKIAFLMVHLHSTSWPERNSRAVKGYSPVVVLEREWQPETHDLWSPLRHQVTFQTLMVQDLHVPFSYE